MTARRQLTWALAGLGTVIVAFFFLVPRPPSECEVPDHRQLGIHLTQVRGERDVLERLEQEARQQRQEAQDAARDAISKRDSARDEVEWLRSAKQDRVIPRETIQRGGDVPGVEVHTNSLGMELVWLPGGTFQMGSPEGQGYDDERPQHPVTIEQGFWIGRNEVTQAAYQKLRAEYPELVAENPSHFPLSEGYERRPVENLTWHQAVAFCRALTKRERAAGRLPEGWVYGLPSEAQWEFACRAGTTDRWSFGDDEGRLGEFAWYTENSKGWTHNVGEKEPNLWGLHDMHGNVWEWCLDPWHSNYQGAPTDGSVWSGDSSSRVLRGGSWFYLARCSRSAFRLNRVADSRYKDYGFRVVVRPGTD